MQQKLLDVFDIEHREHLEAIRQLLAAADGAGLQRPGLAEATRRAHSLKGAARAVGLEHVETVAHRLETLFVTLESGEGALTDEVRQVVLAALDDVEDRVAAGRSGVITSDVPAVPAGAAAPASVDPEAPAAAPAPLAKATASTDSVRIKAEDLDRLLTSAGELHADMLFQQLGAQEIGRIGQRVLALDTQWTRLAKQIEASLGRARAGHGIARLTGGSDLIGTEIRGLAKRLQLASRQQNRCARSLRHHLDDLERRVKSARMVPAESVFGSFRKMVRDVAASEGKEVDVVVEGLDCEADRLVLQRIKDPVMHMLRNAVSHGIEPPDERRARSKDVRGRVALKVSTDHNRLAILIEDDGRGIDFGRIADKAVELGRMSREEAAAAAQQTLCQLLFEPGFSTAGSVTRISGRGIGLSVAREAVIGLQGSVDVHDRPGGGTAIALSLPVNILSRRLLLVSFKEQVYALPSESIGKVLRVAPDAIVRVDGRPAVRFNDSTLPLVSLGGLLRLGDPIVAATGATLCVVVLRAGNAQAGLASHVGVAVEGFLGVNDFVVRGLETNNDDRRLWNGIVSIEDGTPCLVLNAGAILQGELGGVAANVVFGSRNSGPEAAKVVMVVDDSITTRTLEKSILEAHGYEVRLSVDGRDALNRLRSEPPDIVVSDIEMPHLDGFDLVREMKADRALADIPVILVTSRADRADREKGLRLGAEAYVVKQRFDQHDLLRTIRQIV